MNSPAHERLSLAQTSTEEKIEAEKEKRENLLTMIRTHEVNDMLKSLPASSNIREECGELARSGELLVNWSTRSFVTWKTINCEMWQTHT